ncbi:MAG TPA: hypothetical protein DCS19_04930 [Flavobacterium sp.]|nr:hypothetical protein [Flavobacterium sp.]
MSFIDFMENEFRSQNINEGEAGEGEPGTAGYNYLWKDYIKRTRENPERIPGFIADEWIFRHNNPELEFILRQVRGRKLEGVPENFDKIMDWLIKLFQDSKKEWLNSPIFHETEKERTKREVERSRPRDETDWANSSGKAFPHNSPWS